MYITEGDVENLILQDIDSSHSTFIASVIDWVGDYIDQYCGTDFASDSAAATRYFDGSGSNELYIDAFTAISSIEILDVNGNVQQTLTTNDYHLHPYNDTLYNRIILSPGGSISSFPERIRSIKIVGTWGYASVPTPIKLAAVKLAAKVINEGLRGGQVESETLGSYTVKYKQLDDEADALGIKEILNQYRIMTL